MRQRNHGTNPLAGIVTFERTFSGLQTDAGSGTVRLRHRVVVKNTADYPLYEFVYSERSPYHPLYGSSYLHDAPFEDPKTKGEKFFWLLPLLEPESSLEIRFLSEIPKEVLVTRAELSLQKEPNSEPLTVVAKVPAALSRPFDYIYRLNIYFDAGKADLSPDAHAIVNQLGLTLNTEVFDRLLVNLSDYPDGDLSRNLKKQFEQNESLKSERKEAVKKLLQRVLTAEHEIVFE